MTLPKKIWPVALLASLVALAAAAIEPPKSAPPAPARQEPATTPKPEPPSDEAAPADDKAADEGAPAEDEEELPPLPPDTVPAGPPPARFDPSEKVRADFPVSFPIDT